MRFPAVTNCENRFDKVAPDYKAVPFFSRHGVGHIFKYPLRKNTALQSDELARFLAAF